MKLERSDIKFPLWRKKVDNSILNDRETPIPKFMLESWKIEQLFKDCGSVNSAKGKVQILLNKSTFQGNVIHKANGQFKLTIPSNLGDALKQIYVMSYMRYLEDKLRTKKIEYKGLKIEDEIPFWEFLDIEFDSTQKVFYMNAHYIQKPMYLELFREIVNSHVLTDIENVLENKDGLRITKEKWQPKAKLKSQVDAKNVIYNLIDINNKEFYVGEAESLLNRLSGPRHEIPNWTHYRFDSLPNGLTRDQRVAIERLLIRSFASFISNEKEVDSMNVSEYKLKNKKIDN